MRYIKKKLSAFLIVIFMLTNILSPINKVQAQEDSPSEEPKEKVELLIKYKDDSKAESSKDKVETKLKIEDIVVKEEYKKSDVELIEINKEDDLNAVIKEFKKDSNVLFAQPNYELHIDTTSKKTVTEDEERFAELWGLDNNGQTIEGLKGNSGQDISALEAWSITKGSPSVVIGVLDTGIDINHDDLNNNIYKNKGEIAGNGLDDDGNGFIDDINGWDFANGDSTVYDDSSMDIHGTRIAGIIAAEDNEAGMIGAAPKVRILPLKFIKNGTGYTSDAIAAIEYASKMGVKIMNCSFSGADNNLALKEAMFTSNILFVCAAGNDGKDISKSPVYPAGFELANVISVAATNNSGDIAALSNYGINVDVAAPGINILSTQPDNKYGYQNGTSFSAPYVSAIAGLVSSLLPDMTPAQIATRIKSTATKTAAVKDMVAYGLADAASALKNNQVSTVDTNKKDTNNDSNSTTTESVVSICAATVSQTLLEQLHFGETGVSATTGNYSKNDVDMSVVAPGFTVNLSRTYNSKDDRTSSVMGRGWTFGFEGKIRKDTNYANNSLVIATLPNGSVQVFVDTKKDGSAYIANDSRSTLVKNSDGTHTLTTKDQYTYVFNTNSFLSEMRDRNKNSVKISVNASGRVDSVTDTVGRSFTMTYDSNNLLTMITDVSGKRCIKYQYNSNKLLTSVSAITATTLDTSIAFGTETPVNLYSYEYDSSNYLVKVKDGKENVLEQITYDHTTAGAHKVSQSTDSYGKTCKYKYDTANSTTTIAYPMNSKEVTIIKKYDSAYFITQSTDPDGKVTKVEYLLDSNGFNKYGEEKKITDRNGNIIEYDRDDRGNIIAIRRPGISEEKYTYDSKNNTIMEKDAMGKCTYYIYDADKILLQKKVQPLNVSDEYSESADQSKFCVTKYVYYSDEEANSLGYTAKGLLKKQVDPEGGETTYTYDKYGNQASITSPEGNTTKYEYNVLGWLKKTISPSGYATKYDYDLFGRVLRTIQDGGETSRIVYDTMGRTLQEISPNQYDINDDGLNAATPTQTYKSSTAGTRYTYYPSGRVKTVTDVYGNMNSYTYDVCGNTETETLTASDVKMYTKTYTYDVMNRLSTVSIQGKSEESPSLLESDTYAIKDGNAIKTVTQYLNDKDTATTEYTYDYADRLIEQKNPDGGKLTTVYNPNGTVYSSTDAMSAATYCKYDGLNYPTETWSPIQEGAYSYQKITYDKAGNKTSIQTGKDKVELFNVPSSDRLITTKYDYYEDGSLKTETNGIGGKTAYQYDKEGFLSKKDVYTSENVYNTTKYKYNHLGKVITKTSYVNQGDLYANKEDDVDKEALTTSYTYDKNGNVLTVTTPDKNTTTYTYDLLNRATDTEKQEIDETGAPVISKIHTTYDYQGNVVTYQDAKENITTNSYNERGFLTQSKKTVTTSGSAIELISSYYYDLAGRMIAEVSPNNFKASATSYQDMNRTEYVYDSMGRVKAKVEVYKEKEEDASYKTMVSQAYQYDKNGNVTKELDGEGYNYGGGDSIDKKIANGYGTVNLYNQAGLLDTTKNALSQSKKYTYDGAKRKSTETDAKGTVICYYYDNAGNLTSTAIKKSKTEPETVISSSTYDFAGNVIKQTDGNGNETVFQYNALYKPKIAIYPSDSSIASLTITYQYDVMGNLMKSQDSTGKQNLYTYDTEGRVLKQTEQSASAKDAITNTCAYDLNGNTRFETDANGTKKENIYDELNRLIETKLVTTDVINKKAVHSIKYEYDKNGNQIKQTSYLSNVNGTPIATSTIEMVYDPLNRVVAKIDAGVKIQELTYNASHVQTTSTDGRGNTTEYTYDKCNRLTKTVDPEEHSTLQSYDAVGNIATKTDGNGNVTTYSYDQFNRLLTVTNAKDEKTSYTYDSNGNMLTQTDGKGNVTTYEYNAANKPIRKIDHGGKVKVDGKTTYQAKKTETYTYYPNALMATKTDRNGKTTNYTYDIHGRLLSKKIDSNEITYTYDANGNQLTITDSTGITARTYDELNRVKIKTVPNIGANTFQYDIIASKDTIPELSPDQITSGYTAERSKDAKGNVTTKVSDLSGRLVYVIADGKVTAYTYDENGNRASVVYPGNDTKEVYTYDKDNLLLTLTNTVNGVEKDKYTYTYDGAHNQTSKVETINQTLKGTTSYTYDTLNRLTEVVEPKKSTETKGKETSYTYDAAGNRETEKVTVTEVSETKTSVITYQYNEQNRLLSTSQEQSDGTKKTTTYYYDNNGNLTKKNYEQTRKIDPSNPPTAEFGMFIEGQEAATSENAKDIVKGIASYEYDVWNQLIKATTGEGTSSYQYNGEGYRTERTENGITTRSLYEADKVILETDKKGKQTARNVYGTNLLVRTAGEDTFYYMYNGHGDVTALTDANGKTRATYYYDAFGNPDETGTKYYDANGTVVKDAVNNNITYAGYQYDKATGLYYLNARYYDSQIARFMSEDTYSGQANDPLSLNMYTYCDNNPIVYIDPTGHWKSGDEKLNENAKAEIIALSVAYDKATTKAEKKQISSQADAIRKDPSSKKDIDTLLEIKNEYVFDAYMVTAMKDGKLSSGELKSALKIIDATTTTKSYTSINSSEAKKYTDVVTSFGRTDIYVSTTRNLKNESASTALGFTFNYTDTEALFISNVMANYGDITIKESFALLDTLEKNGGSISKSKVEKITGKKVSGQTAGLLEGSYKASTYYLTFGLMDVKDTQKRLDQAYGFVTFLAASAFSGTGASLNRPSMTCTGTSNTSKITSNTVQTTRVGQWMSKSEYTQFVKTGEIPRTNVLTNGKEGYIKQAKIGDYYVEFDVNSSLLVPKNEELGWSLIMSKNNMYLKLAEKKGISLPVPIGYNITHITTK